MPTAREPQRSIGKTPLHHYDQSQLVYQVYETMIERVYLRHGVVVRSGDVVLDVGANVGVVAVFFLKECDAGLVHSFEPVPPLFELLGQNIAPYANGIAHPIGLGSSKGLATIRYYPAAAAMSGFYADPASDRAFVRTCLENGGSSMETVDDALKAFDDVRDLEVEVDTLSSVLRTHGLDAVDLLKIDVEKAELDVLNGIERADWVRIRQVVVEVHDIADRLRGVTRLLEELGFGITVDQEESMRNTDLHLVYGIR